MADDLLQMQVTNVERYRRVRRALRDASEGGGLRREMNKQIRTAANPVVADLRAAAMRIPDVSVATRADKDSFRRMLARATRSSTLQSGVRLLVDGRRMPPGMAGMIFAVERPQGWRHPVFGSGERSRSEWVWVHQAGHPWFFPTAHRHEHDFRDAVMDAVADTIRRIETEGA